MHWRSGELVSEPSSLGLWQLGATEERRERKYTGYLYLEFFYHAKKNKIGSLVYLEMLLGGMRCSLGVHYPSAPSGV
jgi:hypothetical protein